MDERLKNLKVAVLLQKGKVDDNLTILFPIGFSLGEVSKDRNLMYEYSTDRVYKNAKQILLDDEEIYSFYNDFSLDELLQRYENKNLPQIFKILGNYYRENVYFFDETNTIKNMEIKEFEKKYEITLTNEDIDEVEEENEKITTLPPIKKAYDTISENVFSQDSAIKKILTAIYKNFLISDSRFKTNIIMYGESGVGKTEILRQVKNVFGLPVVIEDMNNYTQTGYIGKNIEDLLKKLYIEAGCNIFLAQRGILCLDEIDKKVSNSSLNGDSIATTSVLNALLKLIEGGEYEFEYDGNIVKFDTSYLTVIASGAFSQLKDRVDSNKKKIGFNNEISKSYEFVTDDFISYGLPREFVGRFNCIIKLNDLKKEDLKNILLNSNISSLKINIDMLKKLDTDVHLSDNLIDKIVETAYNQHTGARALNKIINELFDDAFFDIFSTDVEDSLMLEFNDDAMENNKKFVISKKG